MTELARNSRQARHLVRRLRRDCGMDWPGGEENAAIQADRRAGRFCLTTLDGRPAPTLTGPSPLARLLRDGFLVVRWSAGDIRLHHIEDSAEEILAQRPGAKEQN